MMGISDNRMVFRLLVTVIEPVKIVLKTGERHLDDYISNNLSTTSAAAGPRTRAMILVTALRVGEVIQVLASFDVAPDPEPVCLACPLVAGESPEAGRATRGCFCATWPNQQTLSSRTQTEMGTKIR